MREQDLKALESALDAWTEEMGPMRRGIVCSGNDEELRLLEKMFPSIQLINMDRNQWNLDDACPETGDLVLASNVFMCASDPKRWIENVCRQTKYLIILDHCVAWRGGTEGETSPSTGDVMRYTMPPHMVAKLPTAFDFQLVGDRLVSLCPYEYGNSCGVKSYEKTKMFVALLRGDLK